ncbi:MAG TPA: heparinase II/III family protein [Dongiaceae bacterium]
MAGARLRRLSRLLRLPPGKLRGQLIQAALRPLYGSGLYARTLSGRGDGAIQPIRADAWPGDSARGREIAEGLFRLAGQSIREPAPLGRPVGADESWRVAFNSFAWLSDLMALGAGAAPVARAFVERWIAENAGWDAIAWRPDIMGRRLSHWLAEPALVEVAGKVADKAGERNRLFVSANRQARHLARVLPAGLSGAPLLSAIKGLIYGGLALSGGSRLLKIGLKQLSLALAQQLLADGGHVERSPAVQLAVLHDLVDIRAALHAAGHELPGDLSLAIDHMAPVLRMFQAGDGGLALFNDSNEGPAGSVDLTLLRADAKARALASAPQSGFQRLAAGQALLIADAGVPAPPGHDAHAHAGTLSFEFCNGDQRLIVNCGAQGAGGEWRLAQRATAAHSTLTVDDTNSSMLMPDGSGLLRRPTIVACRREEAEGNGWLDMSHDGYQPQFGLTHHRRLFLASDGSDLRGHDRLEGKGGKHFAIRFHLHPQVVANLAQDGQAVLLRLPGGAGFRLRSSGAEVSLAESVYLGGWEMRRSQQVVLSGDLHGAGCDVKWALTRESKK